MKIAVVGRYRNESANGVDRTIVGHISQFIRLNYRVTLFTFDTLDQNAIGDIKKIGVAEVILLEKKFKWIVSLYKMRKRFDLISLHSVFTPYNWAAVTLLRCPFIITPNGGYSPGQIVYKSRYLKKIAIFLFERNMLETARFVHALSQNEQQQIVSIAPTATVRIAANGCIPSSKKIKQNTFSRCKGKCLVFIGRLSIVHKGLDLLISSLRDVDQSLKWSLEIVGIGTPKEERELFKLVSEAGLGDRIVFHGALYGADKERIMASADLFVHTSRWEGMPFSIIEALQEGVPVVVTPETNMGDLIEEYDAGWVIDSPNLSHKMNEILGVSSDEIAKKSHGALKLVDERLNWNRIGTILFEDLSCLE